MEKNQFNILISQYFSSSAEESNEVNALSKKYPYSQLLHTLAARTAKDHQEKDHQLLLQLAAVYSTDRSVLKEIMSAAYSQPTSTQPVTTKFVSENEIKSPIKTATVDTIDYADEVMIDLERLKELKHNFEMMFMDEETPKKVIVSKIEKPKEEAEIKEEKVEKKVEEKASVTEKPKKVRKKSKRERILELTKELLSAEQSNEPESKKPVKKKKSKKKQDSDPLIDEIKATKKKIEPENEKTKEQIQIINQYIKAKPTIAPPKVVAEEKLDLASTLKSGEFGDNIISETLAEILIRQGKKDKAIEVYKKLIWKFPQKKAYFAAQIDELRK